MRPAACGSRKPPSTRLGCTWPSSWWGIPSLRQPLCCPSWTPRRSGLSCTEPRYTLPSASAIAILVSPRHQSFDSCLPHRRRLRTAGPRSSSPSASCVGIWSCRSGCRFSGLAGGWQGRLCSGPRCCGTHRSQASPCSSANQAAGGSSSRCSLLLPCSPAFAFVVVAVHIPALSPNRLFHSHFSIIDTGAQHLKECCMLSLALWQYQLRNLSIQVLPSMRR